MAAITPITANPDTNNPSAFPVQADLAWAQLKVAIPQINDVIAAFNLNDIEDTSTTSTAIGNGAKTFTVSANKSFRPGMVLTFADASLPSTNLMQGIVESYSGTSLSVTVIQTRGTGTYANWVISIAPMPMLEYDSSVLALTTGAVMATTNTRIRRFTTIATNTATNDITYADSVTLGASITFLTAGWYKITLADAVSSGVAEGLGIGLSVNSAQLTTNISGIDQTKVVARPFIIDATNSFKGRCEVTYFFQIGDVLRPHYSNGAYRTGNAEDTLIIRKISLSGVSTGGGGGGGGGAPTDAQYIVATADGTLSNERVATSSTSVLSNTGTSGQIEFQRAAITGHVAIPLNSNTATIQPNVVTDAMLADMDANSVKLNNTNAAGDPVNLPIAVQSILGRQAGNIVNIPVSTNQILLRGTGNVVNGGLSTGLSIVADVLTVSIYWDGTTLRNTAGDDIGGTPTAETWADLGSAVGKADLNSVVRNPGGNVLATNRIRPIPITAHSDNVSWRHLGGTYDLAVEAPYINMVAPAITFDDGVGYTYATASAGARTRINGGGAHGLTVGNTTATGSKVYVDETSGANWVAGWYTVTALDLDTTGTQVTIDHPFSASFGTLVLALAGADIVSYRIKLPALATIGGGVIIDESVKHVTIGGLKRLSIYHGATGVAATSGVKYYEVGDSINQPLTRSPGIGFQNYAAANQIGFNLFSSATQSGSTTTGAEVLGTINTSVSTDLLFVIRLAQANDVLRFNRFTVRVI